MSESVTSAVEALMARDATAGVSSAVVVSVSGEVVAERYGVIPGNALREERVVDASTPLLSWSVAKSVVHAIVGVLVADARVDLDAPIGLSGGARSGITWLDLLEMRSGLAFIEEYEIGQPSDCIEMLFSGDDASGVPDMGEFAAARDVVDQPGRLWNYSSGSTNIVCRAIGDLLAGPASTTPPDVRAAAITNFVTERLMGPLGIDDWSVRVDASGTLIGSSFMFMSARSWVEFGELYRRKGVAAMDSYCCPTHGVIMREPPSPMILTVMDPTGLATADTGGPGRTARAYSPHTGSRASSWWCGQSARSPWRISVSHLGPRPRVSSPPSIACLTRWAEDLRRCAPQRCRRMLIGSLRPWFTW
jgi:CubicO group peptidase (beta-lactamase class C family)